MAMTSGAKIQIDKETKMIKISGFKDKVETAKHMLEAFMADYVPRDQQQYQKTTDVAASAAATTAIFGQTLEQQNAAAAHEASLKKEEEEEKPLWETIKARKDSRIITTRRRVKRSGRCPTITTVLVKKKKLAHNHNRKEFTVNIYNSFKSSACASKYTHIS